MDSSPTTAGGEVAGVAGWLFVLMEGMDQQGSIGDTELTPSACCIACTNP